VPGTNGVNLGDLEPEGRQHVATDVSPWRGGGSTPSLSSAPARGRQKRGARCAQTEALSPPWGGFGGVACRVPTARAVGYMLPPFGLGRRPDHGLSPKEEPLLR